MTANRKRKQKVRKLAAERDLDYSDALEVFNEREARWRPTTVYDYLLVREMPERRARIMELDPNPQGNVAQTPGFTDEPGGVRKTEAVAVWPDGLPGLAALGVAASAFEWTPTSERVDRLVLAFARAQPSTSTRPQGGATGERLADRGVDSAGGDGNLLAAMIERASLVDLGNLVIDVPPTGSALLELPWPLRGRRD